MRNRKTKSYLKTVYIIVIPVLLWVYTTVMIQRFKCSEMTETQLFLNIPNSIVCNWQHCK